MRDEQESLTHHPPPPIQAVDRDHLRLALRQRRNGVPRSIAGAAARAIAKHVSHSGLLARQQRIAVYAAFDGEIDLAYVVRYAQRLGCTLYAPRITNMRARRMEFIKLAGRTGQRRNRFSILEPRGHLQRRIDPRQIDVVFIPVVAFDAYGWRLGFGAGFYDRKFGFLRRRFSRKPVLIGVGYEFQRVPHQAPCPWDVSLDFFDT
jgi:5-formyltetrahydrofolate cyclo-ligase